MFSLLRSVFEILIENHFPAPSRGFLDEIQNSNQPAHKNRSPSPLKTRRSDLKRKVLADLDFRRSNKKARVIHSDESDTENQQDREPVMKTQPLVYSDDSESENEVDKKPSIKSEKMNGAESEKSDDEDDFSGIFYIIVSKNFIFQRRNVVFKNVPKKK